MEVRNNGTRFIDYNKWEKEYNLQQQMIPFEQQSAILGYIDNIASAYIANGWDTATAYTKANVSGRSSTN